MSGTYAYRHRLSSGPYANSLKQTRDVRNMVKTYKKVIKFYLRRAERAIAGPGLTAGMLYEK